MFSVNEMTILEDGSFDEPLLEIQRFRGQGTQKHIPDQCNTQMIQQITRNREVTWLKPIDRIASLSSPLIHRSFRNLGIRGTVCSCVNVRPTRRTLSKARVKRNKVDKLRSGWTSSLARARARADNPFRRATVCFLKHFFFFFFLNVFFRYTATRLNGLLLEGNL